MDHKREEFFKKCKDIRKSIINTAFHAQRGHIPSAFSTVETIVILYYLYMKHDPKDPKMIDRDRFILSKGHGCLGLYAVLADLEYFNPDELKKFCKMGGILGGHPSRGKIPGIEVSSGSLGLSLSVGVGISLYLKLKGLQSKTFVLLGDGECNEGVIWEAALSANKNSLENLWVLIDYNKYQSFGKIDEVCPLNPIVDKWLSFGFKVFEADMVNKPLDLLSIIKNGGGEQSPNVVICHTLKGQGAPSIIDKPSWHHIRSMSTEQRDFLFEEVELQ